MKYLILCFLSAFYCNAQELVYTEIDSTIKGSKDELFVKSKSWVANYFRDAKSVIQLDDKDSGKLICKGLYKVPLKNGFGMVVEHDILWFTLTINVKENKTRIIASDFTHESYNESKHASIGNLLNPYKQWGSFNFKSFLKELKEDADAQAKLALTSYHDFMHTASPADDKF